MADGGAQSVGLLQVAVFFDELALLAVLAVAGARLADGTALIAVASALLAWAGSPWWSAAFLVVSAALVTLGEMSEQV